MHTIKEDLYYYKYIFTEEHVSILNNFILLKNFPNW